VLLFQSVRELLFNAVKHAKVQKARVDVQRADEHVRIVVSDEGRGFDPARLAGRVVDKGGFGLFSIRERMGFLGGRLEIESAPGRGSRFTLVAPLKPTVAREVLPLSPTPTVTKAADAGRQARPAGGTGRRIRVLLVDDHLVVRQGLARLLAEEADFEVVGEASDGPAALDLARKFQPDVVTMDLNMPGMNGVEATRRLLVDLPRVKVIGLSMFEERERAAEMQAAGAVDYLAKSGPVNELVAAIRTWAKADASTP